MSIQFGCRMVQVSISIECKVDFREDPEKPLRQRWGVAWASYHPWVDGRYFGCTNEQSNLEQFIALSSGISRPLLPLCRSRRKGVFTFCVLLLFFFRAPGAPLLQPTCCRFGAPVCFAASCSLFCFAFVGSPQRLHKASFCGFAAKEVGVR